MRKLSLMPGFSSGSLSKALMACFYIIAGINHFWHPAIYFKIMPPLLPQHGLLIAISGLAEILLGVLLWFSSITVYAAWGIIALLVAVFPANIYLAVHPEVFPAIPAWFFWLRLPLQGVFILWAYSFTHKK